MLFCSEEFIFIFLPVFLVLEKFFLGRFWEKHSILGWVYTMLVVVTGWVIFSVEKLSDIGIYLSKMFVWTPGWNSNPSVTMRAVMRYGIFLVVAMVCSTCLVENVFRKYRERLWLKAVLLILFWVCVYRIHTAASNPFLYFRF